MCLNKDEDDVASDSAEDCDGYEFKQMWPNESEFSITLAFIFLPVLIYIDAIIFFFN